MVKNYALGHIKDMTPYLPPLEGRLDFSGDLLDFNERECVPSKKVARDLTAFILKGKMQRYPEYISLQKKVAKYVGVSVDQIMMTNGSDHAIDIVFRTFVAKKDTVVLSAPTFPMFVQYAKILGCNLVEVPYGKIDFSFPLEVILQTIKKKRPKLVVVCNPNNPTGTLISLKVIESMVKNAPGSLFMIDEAYFEFSGITAVSLVSKFPNVVILRTFSKAFGLAALRVGYIIASAVHIKEMMKVRGPYSVNMFADVAANAAIEDTENMKKYVQEVVGKAKPLLEEFFKKNNILFYETGANFMLFKPSDKSKLHKYLQRKDIRVRSLNTPGVEDMLRISIGTVQQMKRFVAVYLQFLVKKKQLI